MFPENDKKMAAAIVAKMNPGKGSDPMPGDSEEEDVADDPSAGLSVASEDLLAAFEAKDATGIASALRAAFDCMRSAPDEE
jgi:hypothetical protein